MLKRIAAIYLTFSLLMVFTLTWVNHAEAAGASLTAPQGVTASTQGTNLLVNWQNPAGMSELAESSYENWEGTLFYIVDWRVNGGAWHYDREIPWGKGIYDIYPNISMQFFGAVYDAGNSKKIISQTAIDKVLIGIPYDTPVEEWLKRNNVEFRIRYIYNYWDVNSEEEGYQHSEFSTPVKLGTANPTGSPGTGPGIGEYGIPQAPSSIEAPQELVSEYMTLNLRWRVPESIKTLIDMEIFMIYAVIDWKVNNGEWHDGLKGLEEISYMQLIRRPEDLTPDKYGYVRMTMDRGALEIPYGISLSTWLADKTYCFRVRYVLQVPEGDGIKNVISPYSNTVTLGKDTGTATSTQTAGGMSNRLWGDDRYKTAAAISREGWEKSDNVVLVDGNYFPDALVGSSFAYLKNAPVLITDSNTLNSDTRTEIRRLGAKTIYILGNYDSVSKTVEDELKQNYTVVRIGGPGVFDTAVKVGEEVRKIKQFNIVAIATQNDFPDALAIAPFSARDTIPILFSEKDRLRPDTKKALQDWGIEHVIITGGTGVVSSDVENEMNGMGIYVERLWGDDRYGTALDVARRFETQNGYGCISLATGRDYPDALTGAVLAAKNDAPIFLVDKDYMDADVIEYINVQFVDKIYIFGGNGVVSNSAISQIGK